MSRPLTLSLDDLRRRADAAGADVELWDRDGAHVQFEADVDGQWLVTDWLDITELPTWARELVHQSKVDAYCALDDYTERMRERRQMGLGERF